MSDIDNNIWWFFVMVGIPHANYKGGGITPDHACMYDSLLSEVSMCKLRVEFLG